VSAGGSLEGGKEIGWKQQMPCACPMTVDSGLVFFIDLTL
jgi:hypothetical protein